MLTKCSIALLLLIQVIKLLRLKNTHLFVCCFPLYLSTERSIFLSMTVPRFTSLAPENCLPGRRYRHFQRRWSGRWEGKSLSSTGLWHCWQAVIILGLADKRQATGAQFGNQGNHRFPRNHQRRDERERTERQWPRLTFNQSGQGGKFNIKSRLQDTSFSSQQNYLVCSTRQRKHGTHSLVLVFSGSAEWGPGRGVCPGCSG